MEQYTNEGKIDEDILPAAATRIVKVKFQMGVFENPYCDVDYAVSFVGNEESKAVNLEAARKPMVTVVTGGRPYILTWCDENTNAILEAYYPGQQGGIAIAETLFGLNNPTGKTPIQFPRDMASVNNQASDVSFDLENPLYDYGWGLSYDE